MVYDGLWVSWVMGVPPVIIHFDRWDFPRFFYHPAMVRGSPMTSRKPPWLWEPIEKNQSMLIDSIWLNHHFDYMVGNSILGKMMLMCCAHRLVISNRTTCSTGQNTKACKNSGAGSWICPYHGLVNVLIFHITNYWAMVESDVQTTQNRSSPHRTSSSGKSASLGKSP